jgi:hypothetical protein
MAAAFLRRCTADGEMDLIQGDVWFGSNEWDM